MKYRIVERPGKTYCYYAQKKVLWWWVDLPTHSLSAYRDTPACETPSHSQELVEKYIEHIVMKKKDIVVKEYED
jgi:hypothetical protein